MKDVDKELCPRYGTMQISNGTKFDRHYTHACSEHGVDNIIDLIWFDLLLWWCCDERKSSKQWWLNHRCEKEKREFDTYTKKTSCVFSNFTGEFCAVDDVTTAGRNFEFLRNVGRKERGIF